MIDYLRTGRRQLACHDVYDEVPPEVSRLLEDPVVSSDVVSSFQYRTGTNPHQNEFYVR
jgi:hypothetical protein